MLGGCSASWAGVASVPPLLLQHNEPVFVTFQLRLALKTYAEICAPLDFSEQQAWAENSPAALDKNITAVFWDGYWFIWAIAEDGTLFGMKNYPEGQVYLNTQAWAIISGAASDEQADARPCQSAASASRELGRGDVRAAF